MRLRLFAFALLACAPNRDAVAQSVSGRVTDAGGAALPGVMITLVDAAGSVVSRALTSAGGDYRLVPAAPGTYRLRTLRIGYAPTLSESFAIRGDEHAKRDLSVEPVAVRLDTVVTVGRSECRSITGADATAAFRAWEQVVAALEAVDITAGRRALGVTSISHEQGEAPGAGTVRYRNRSITRGFTRGLWATRSPRAVHDSGYVREDADGGFTYFLPDVAVLLSPEFLSDHCFRLRRANDSVVALQFEPLPARRAGTGIRGELLLEPRSARLSRLELQYVNLPEHHDLARPSAAIEFAQASSGSWFVRDWWIRTPVLERRMVVATSSRLTRRTEWQTHVAGTRREGASLALVTDGPDTLWAAPARVLRGVVVDSLTGQPVSGAKVSLASTTLSATSDPAGEFAFEVVPGDYQIQATRPSTDGTPYTGRSFVRVLDGDTTSVVRLPSGSVIRGSVIDAANARPVGGALVSIGSRTIVTDSAGVFQITGLGAGAHQVMARRLGYTPRTVTVTLARHALAQRTLVLERVPVLDTVTVRAANVIPSFEEHRKARLGHFLTPEQLERQWDRKLRDVIAQLPSARIMNGRGQTAFLHSARVAVTSIQPGGRGRGDDKCWTQVYLDDILIYGNRPGDEPFNLNQLATSSVQAIEFYPGPATTPLRYSTLESQCGVLVIHTRRTRK